MGDRKFLKVLQTSISRDTAIATKLAEVVVLSLLYRGDQSGGFTAPSNPKVWNLVPNSWTSPLCGVIRSCPLRTNPCSTLTQMITSTSSSCPSPSKPILQVPSIWYSKRQLAGWEKKKTIINNPCWFVSEREITQEGSWPNRFTIYDIL